MRWIRALLGLRPRPSPVRRRAVDLIKAVDAGGLPLHPARVNDIARQLGLVVSKTENVGDTVARIRAALAQELP